MVLILLAPLLRPAEVAPPPRPVVAAPLTSSLPSADGGICQFAFDADPASSFTSAKNPAAADHLTLIFDTPVRIRSLGVVTGRADGADKLPPESLEVSADGKSFAPVAGELPPLVNAVRVRPGARNHPLIIRDFVIDSEPTQRADAPGQIRRGGVEHPHRQGRRGVGAGVAADAEGLARHFPIDVKSQINAPPL